MSYKVKVTKKKKYKPIPKPYYECTKCGYQDDMGGFCPNCDYPDMEYCLPEEFESLAEYLLDAAYKNENSNNERKDVIYVWSKERNNKRRKQ